MGKRAACLHMRSCARGASQAAGQPHLVGEHALQCHALVWVGRRLLALRPIAQLPVLCLAPAKRQYFQICTICTFRRPCAIVGVSGFGACYEQGIQQFHSLGLTPGNGGGVDIGVGRGAKGVGAGGDGTNLPAGQLVDHLGVHRVVAAGLQLAPRHQLLPNHRTEAARRPARHLRRAQEK